MSRVPFANNADPNNSSSTSGGGGGGGGNNNTSNINYRTLRDYGATTTTTTAGNSSGAGLINPQVVPAVVPTNASSIVSLVDQRGGGSFVVPDVTFAGFSPTEFMSLSEGIAQNISAVRSSLHMLEQTIRKIGTHSDGTRFRAKLQNEQASTNRKIETTTADLKRLNDVVRHGDKQQKLNVSRLTSEFSSIVASYSKCQKEIGLKQRMNALPPSNNAAQFDDPNGIGSYQNGASAQQLQQQQQQQMRQSLELERQLLLEREERMADIQSNVLDINAIMHQLGSMTQAQGENIDMIEGNITNTEEEVTRGMTELQKAAQQQAKYRKRMLMLVVIAVIIGLILTGIIVASFKS